MGDTYRSCSKCGHYASVILGDKKQVLLCPVCLDESDIDTNSFRPICSVEGCYNPPNYIAMLTSGPQAPLFLCEGHYNKVESQVSVYFAIPDWLCGYEDIITDKDGVSVEIPHKLKMDRFQLNYSNFGGERPTGILLKKHRFDPRPVW